MLNLTRNVVCISALIALTLSTSFSQTDPFSNNANKVLPSVVRIMAQTTLEKAQAMMADIVQASDSIVYSTGTGFFVTSDGLLATADHVIAPTTGEVKVFAPDPTMQREYQASIVHRDTIADFALLKIQKSNCVPVILRDPISAQRGIELGFIGFPLDFDFALISKTILSAKINAPLRDSLPSRNQLVINAFVNHGNSGGPLFLASTGEVIGIVSSRSSPKIKERLIEIPKNYRSGITIGRIDPILFAAQIYNENLTYLGEVSQFGIGFCPTVEYLLAQLGRR